MYHSPISYHADLPQHGALKTELNSEGELGISTDSAVDDHDFRMPDISRHIIDEVDLEVSIRERLAVAVEGRIQWALRMLDALSNVKEPRDQPLDEDDFQDAALDAFDAVEAPSSFIFDIGLPEERSPSPSFTPITPNLPKTRSSRTPKPSQQKKHLFIKLPSNTSDSQLALLACPACNRTQFTTLQGLLNHARLAHGIEWASHDACITASATPIPADTESWEMYEREGVEVSWGGSVVGLRRLFERAVGVDDIIPAPPAHTTSDAFFESSVTVPSTLLSRTLGLHADSPALAQFLGRAPKRRCIHVHDEDLHIDITTLEDTNSRPDGPGSKEPKEVEKRFYMRYPHRNTARSDLDLVVDVVSAVGVGARGASNPPPPPTVPAGTTASRFHITARICLEDRSLCLKEDLRAQLGITDQYRWMLGVTAPSYSLPLSSFLNCMTVVPPRTVSPVFLTTRQEPFAVIGTANEPFMAKVIFEWVGGGKMEVEHWIELDQSRSLSSVFGSEQLLDIELDRNTPLPVPKGSPPSLPSLDRQLPCKSALSNISLTNPLHGEASADKEDYYEQVLRTFLPRVPMTAKDVKPRTTTQVPYKLVASPAHLLALVPGRRKSIEWARARSLHSLYVDHMASVPLSRQTALTVGDVYKFLEDMSHFPRPSHPSSTTLPVPKKRGREKDGSPIPGEDLCPICGIKKRLHPGYDRRDEGTPDWACVVVPIADQRCGASLPLVNLNKALTWPDGLEQAVRGPPLSTSSIPKQVLKMFLPPFRHTPRDLVTLSPPEFIFAVHRVASKLRLPTFPDLTSFKQNNGFLTSGDHAEQCLAPAALLAATLKPFISTLLRSAIEIAKQDATTITPGTKPNRGKRAKPVTFTLTPGHILRGLRPQTSSNQRAVSHTTIARMPTGYVPQTKESVALCLTRFGVHLDFGKDLPNGSVAGSAEPSTGPNAVGCSEGAAMSDCGTH